MTEKFTASQWAEIEGGHEVTPIKEESFGFLKSLGEARMTRNERDAKVLTYTDCCERAYLTMLVLQLFRYYPKYAGVAAAYAKRTDDTDYKHFKPYATDLYNFVYFIQGDRTAFAKLKDPNTAQSQSQRTRLPTLHYKKFLSKVRTNTATQRIDQEVFLRLESGLNITNTDYKSVRRSLFTWPSLSTKEREAIVTRLLFAARAKLRNADIIDELQALATVKDLENNTLPDPEPTVSTPDLTVTAQDMNLYRFLVGTDNMVMAKKFLELAKNGKPIPAAFVKAYLPAIQAVDDIVKAGPGYVQMLRQLQNRAKKNHKK